MNEDFRQVLYVLYEKFGDQGIAWVKQTVETSLADPGLPESSSGGDEYEDFADAQYEYAEAADDLPIDQLPDYDDEDAFAASVQNRVEDFAIESIVSPENVVDVVLGLVSMAGEVRKFEEAQVTKRVGIAADRDIAIAKIRAQQELLQDYLHRSFDERAENFAKLFATVDRALETCNMNALATGLESVVRLATSSPFKDLASIEATTAALNDPGHEWDF